MAEEKIRNIIRILDTDIEGNVIMEKGLRKIKGVGFSFSNAICNIFDYDKRKKIGTLNDKDLKQIEELIKNPKDKLPKWMLNRRRDIYTGEDMHLTSTNLKLSKEFDIKNMKKTKSYKGMRHAQGLPVRGQRTKGHFRKGKSVGVSKKVKKGKKS